ncbi:IS1 family transposase [Polyangium aurulentum]|uniref:IS1 family transposase n=1 Tax=Polyangium aurulentum TaxID=2567896 RepID=UPI0010ADF587|nr:IS1 family transposase [Polyangium aurulentum]UQA63821.1 IS1 family transposase [Polyangium aurulentum]
MANVLPLQKRVDVVSHLVEGASVRSTSRLTEVSQPAIFSLLVRMGEGCDRLHDRLVRDLAIRDVEVDEIWSYVQKKQARVTAEDPPEFGDAYAFLAMARTCKLMIAYRVGKRVEHTTRAFIGDLRARLVTIPQISTDGFVPYVSAVGETFAGSADHAVIQKNYTKRARREGPADHRYEPPRDPFITKKVGSGAPDLNAAGTSRIERANLTVRMHIRRFTRLCNGFSRKIENHRAAVALHVAWYNFCRVHESLRVTPAMEAGIATHVWSVAELVERALSEPPGEKPVPKPLDLPKAPEGKPEQTARQLPNGKGWLRVVPGGKGAPAAPKAPTPPEPLASPVASAPEPVAAPSGATAMAEAWEQLDLLAWRPREQQLCLLDLT